MERYINRSGCQQSTCTCHDDSAWQLRKNGEPKTYKYGCSQCGCRWGFKAPAQNKTRRETVAAILAGKTPVKLVESYGMHRFHTGQPSVLWVFPLDLSDDARQARLDAAADHSDGQSSFTGYQDDYAMMPLHVKPFKEMTSGERDRYLGAQVKRWSSHEGLQEHEREVKDYSPYGVAEEVAA
jgi:hypothetical protein